jgi:hypothetical protein
MVAVTGGQPIFSRRPHQKPQLPFHLITEELLLWDLCLLGKGRIGARGGSGQRYPPRRPPSLLAGGRASCGLNLDL